jgi:hypothetical protein
VTDEHFDAVRVRYNTGKHATAEHFYEAVVDSLLYVIGYAYTADGTAVAVFADF